MAQQRLAPVRGRSTVPADDEAALAGLARRLRDGTADYLADPEVLTRYVGRVEGRLILVHSDMFRSPVVAAAMARFAAAPNAH